MQFIFSREKIFYSLIGLLFIFGMFVPSSVDAKIQVLPVYYPIITLIAFMLLILINGNLNKKFLIAALIINFIVWFGTFINPGDRIRNLAGLGYINISLLFLLNLSKEYRIEYSKKFFDIANIIVIIIGFLMIFSSNDIIYSFFISYYSDFYPELLPNMLMQGKPVITFGTHSLSAFYLFIFFYLNIKTYNVLNKKVYLIFSLIYLYFCFELNSNSGYLFLLFGIVLLLNYLKLKILVTTSFAVIFGVYILTDPLGFNQILNGIKLLVIDITSSDINGVLGRYSLYGNQYNNLSYISENPFLPTGLSAINGLTFHDSGIIATTLEGTILLTVIFYGALYLFLKSNFINKSTALIIFGSLMIMQLGYNNLFYFRSLFIIPFIIVYLNSLEFERDLKVSKAKHIIKKTSNYLFKYNVNQELK